MQLFASFVVVSVIGVLTVLGTVLFIRLIDRLIGGTRRSIPRHTQCEQTVSTALQNMNLRTAVKSYVVYDNLILRSNGNLSHTEIDHVVISPYGIFCIETKSHSGSIYGYSTAKKWKQYLGGKEFSFYNPQKQNYAHEQALKLLLGAHITTPIHTYVVFPNATKVKVDGEPVDMSIARVVQRIENHTRQVYNLEQCKDILQILAHASARRSELRDAHIAEVSKHVHTANVR